MRRVLRACEFCRTSNGTRIGKEVGKTGEGKVGWLMVVSESDAIT